MQLKLLMLLGLVATSFAQANDSKEDPRAAEIALQVAIRKAEQNAAREVRQPHVAKVSRNRLFFDDRKIEDSVRLVFQKNLVAAHAHAKEQLRNQRYSAGRKLAHQKVQVAYEFEVNHETGAVSLLQPLSDGKYKVVRTFGN